MKSLVIVVMIPRTLLCMGKRTDFNHWVGSGVGTWEAVVLTEKGTLFNQEYRVPLLGRKCQLLQIGPPRGRPPGRQAYYRETT